MRASGGFNEDHVGTQISQNLPADHGTFVGQIDHAIWTEHDPFSLLCERGKRPVCRGFTEALGWPRLRVVHGYNSGKARPNRRPLNPIESIRHNQYLQRLKSYQRGINDAFRSWSNCQAIRRRKGPRYLLLILDGMLPLQPLPIEVKSAATRPPLRQASCLYLSSPGPRG